MTTACMAQVNINGKVTDEAGIALPKASVQIISEGKKSTIVTDNEGNFSFDGLKKGTATKLSAAFTGRQLADTMFIARDNETIELVLFSSPAYLQPIEVKAVRASDKAPFTKTNLNKQQIEVLNTGQDLPYILSQTPSVTTTSDAGNGVGYTGIRIRGTDASRINVTLNGIPYNDAESQQTYFVDLPDFASSSNSIQVQRGVGTSTNGGGAFGATINISTNELNEKAYAESNNSYGSFNTWKNTVKVGSGLINNHFTIDARLSRIASDGYIDRAFSDLQSFYVSGAYINQKTSVRLNIFSGKEKTYQAWYGITEDQLKNDRTYNPAGTDKPGDPYSNQTDNYVQKHFQLFLNHALNTYTTLNVATFLTRGNGYYEEYKAGRYLNDYGLPNAIIGMDTIETTDLVRRLWLDNYFYGQTFALQYKKAANEITLGGAWTAYSGKHFGNVIWGNIGIPADYEYYRFPANKNDMNVYGKWMYNFKPYWSYFADVQYRHVQYSMNGFRDHPELFISRNFDFLNPKAGITYYKNNLQAYASFAVANKEPNRDDFEAGSVQQPKPERLNDFEAGIEKKSNKYNWGITAYYMLYKDQLALTGKINDVGSYTRINVPESYRMGIELTAGAHLTEWFSASGNLTLSRNKIKAFSEYIDNYDDYSQKIVEHSNTDIAFSPSVIANAMIEFTPLKGANIAFPAKFVGDQYLDNSQNEFRKLDGYFVQDVRLSYSLKNTIFKESTIMFQVNNILNNLYEPNGYTYPYIYDNSLIEANYYYPVAGSNFMVTVNLTF